ncbi:MAG TPA: alpha-amylase family glycosyl hydrolase [Ignavibacteriaceae bacterium]
MKKYLFYFLLFLIISINSFSQNINDLIQVLNIPAGEKKTFLISDLFFTDKEYRVTFNPDSSLKIFYEAENGQLEITSSKNSGYSVLPFIFYDSTYHILCKTEYKQTINFSYKPARSVKKVNLFGSFNGWNRENLPMADEDANGIFSTEVHLEPSRYEYKFFVEFTGSENEYELIDPQNTDSITNGLDGWNSVLIVGNPNSNKSFLHLLDYSSDQSNNIFSFYYESGNILEYEIIALINNELLPPNFISKKEKKFSINIPLQHLNGTKTLRVAVNDNGRASNLQTIFLKDGKPIGNRDTTWYDAVIYSIMVDRFNDGDSSNSIPVEHFELLKQANYYGGDLQGIIDKLEEGYFTSLGINTLWLSPVIDNTPNAYQEYPEPHRYYTGYHGYWPVHPAKVEERFGDINLLKELINTAHKKGIKVLLDYVANHIHIEHPFWEEHRDWFGTLELPDGRRNLRLWDEHRLTTWFEPFMPKFDYEGSKEALDIMTDNAVWWLKETGADGFRHDAVKHVPNEFWRTLTRKIKNELAGGKVYYQIGETFGSYELVSSYVNNGQLDAQFNFILYDTAIPAFTDSSTSFAALDQQMQKTFDVYGVNHLMGNVMDSHDKVRFMSYADGDVSLTDGNAIEAGWNYPPEVDNIESYNKLKLYFAYMMTIPGLPVVYYGDEFGMTGAGDPDNRRMMRFDNELSEAEKETLNDVKKIIKLRNQHSAMRYGDFQTLSVDENFYVYLRSDLNERILVVLNKSKEEKKLDLLLPDIYNLVKAKELISGEEFEIKNDHLLLTAGSTSYNIFLLEK